MPVTLPPLPAPVVAAGIGPNAAGAGLTALEPEGNPEL